jgi:hypothetical protein
MTAIARVISSASGTSVNVETLRTVLMFSAVGLTASLLAASYGIDLSPGLFSAPRRMRRCSPRNSSFCWKRSKAAAIPMAVLAWLAARRMSR